MEPCALPGSGPSGTLELAVWKITSHPTERGSLVEEELLWRKELPRPALPGLSERPETWDVPLLAPHRKDGAALLEAVGCWASPPSLGAPGRASRPGPSLGLGRAEVLWKEEQKTPAEGPSLSSPALKRGRRCLAS